MTKRLAPIGLIWALTWAGASAADGPPVRIALKGFDPVTLIEGSPVAGSEEFTARRGRFLYRFATAEHRARFEAEPGRYAVQAETCAVMPRVPASGDLYLVHDGKIYLFGTPGCRARFEADPTAFLRPAARKTVAILIYEGADLLDVAGPGEVFTLAGGGRSFEVFTVAARAEPVRGAGGVALAPRYTLADAPRADILVLPGGATREVADDPAAVAWVRKAAGEAEITLSVCTGALILARAGLLDGLEATTHHGSLEELRRAAPGAKVVEVRRFVDNGKVVTSAGVSAGIDASLHLVDRLLGPGAAAEAARIMEYPVTSADRPATGR